MNQNLSQLIELTIHSLTFYKINDNNVSERKRKAAKRSGRVS